ncbi:MAG: PadR family transcriptional regulator [Conexivisphaerales archaeon]
MWEFQAEHKYIVHPIKSYLESSNPEWQVVAEMAKSDEAEMCDMRGMLSFLILWLLSNRPMYGQELATEIGKRKGDKPNPGTIYPALKDLSKRGFIVAHTEGRNQVYQLTEKGRGSLSKSLKYFDRAFGEILRSSAIRDK